MPSAVIQASFPRGVVPSIRPHLTARPPVSPPVTRTAVPHTVVQRHGNGHAFPLPDGFVPQRGTGQPLPAAVRQRMERGLSADFSDVRVHVGHEAAQIGALAFTSGTDIYFARGQYNPHSAHGQNLLGHELAHVVQQRSGRVRNPFGSGVAVVQDHALEAEADRMAQRLSAPPMPVSGALVRRTPTTTGRDPLVQRRMELQPTPPPDLSRLAWRLAYTARSYNWPPIAGTTTVDDTKQALERALKAMKEEPKNFGTFDVEDDQHLGLLYFEARSIALRPPVRPVHGIRKAATAPKAGVYELAFIGAGSATAYYIDTLGPLYDHSTTLLFGDAGKNPWKEQRGFSIDFINHVRRQIDMPSHKVGEYPTGARTTELFVKRQDFAEDAAAVIAKAIPEANCIKVPITENGISRDPKTQLFHIHVERRTEYNVAYHEKTYKVKNVVFAAGAGGHKVPALKGDDPTAPSYDLDVEPADRWKILPNVIDMDAFIRHRVLNPPAPKALLKGKVVVMGGNAAIDAVAAAKRYGWEVIWFSGDPAFLPGTFYMDAPYSLQAVERRDAVHVEVTQTGGKLNVYYCDQIRKDPGKHLRADECKRPRQGQNGKKVEQGVDYIVYGIGQAGTLGKLLAKELYEELDVEYEKTFKFAPGTHETLERDLAEYVAKRSKNQIAKNDKMEERLVAWETNRVKGKAFVGLTSTKKELDRALWGAGGPHTRSSTLLVIGGAAEADPKSRPDPKTRVSPVGAGIGSVTGAVSSDVLTPGQLAYIRAAVVAHNQFIPPSVGQRVDYGHANADILRAHLAAKYSDIGEGKLDPTDSIATRAIQIIMGLARDRRIPHGYTAQQEGIISRWLGILNASFRASDSLPIMQMRLTNMGNEIAESISKANLNPTYMTWLKANTTEYDAFKKEQLAKADALKLDRAYFV